jgi:hypothetical protein
VQLVSVRQATQVPALEQCGLAMLVHWVSDVHCTQLCVVGLHIPAAPQVLPPSPVVRHPTHCPADVSQYGVVGGHMPSPLHGVAGAASFPPELEEPEDEEVLLPTPEELLEEPPDVPEEVPPPSSPPDDDPGPIPELPDDDKPELLPELVPFPTPPSLDFEELLPPHATATPTTTEMVPTDFKTFMRPIVAQCRAQGISRHTWNTRAV